MTTATTTPTRTAAENAASAAQDLATAQADVKRLTARKRELPGLWEQAVERADGTAMVTIRREQQEVDDLLAAARITIARRELASLDAEIAAARARITPYEEPLRLALAEGERPKRAFEEAQISYNRASGNHGAAKGAVESLQLERREAEGRLQAMIQGAKDAMLAAGN